MLLINIIFYMHIGKLVKIYAILLSTLTVEPMGRRVELFTNCGRMRSQLGEFNLLF